MLRKLRDENKQNASNTELRMGFHLESGSRETGSHGPTSAEPEPIYSFSLVLSLVSGQTCGLFSLPFSASSAATRYHVLPCFVTCRSLCFKFGSSALYLLVEQKMIDARTAFFSLDSFLRSFSSLCLSLAYSFPVIARSFFSRTQNGAFPSFPILFFFRVLSNAEFRSCQRRKVLTHRQFTR